ncbi:MAG: GNAT family N-acetyltransferase [Deltaproteobacteria bacterium]|nr:GNAT family N-acetyltransferase [Deltaproteobacteria bacterium]
MMEFERLNETSVPHPTHRVTWECLDDLFHLWRSALHPLRWDCLFTTPVWLRVWWESFQTGPPPPLPVVWRRKEILGIAPLVLKEDSAVLMGSGDVSDFLDIIPRCGCEDLFLQILVGHLAEKGIRRFSLGPVLKDSHLYMSLQRLEQSDGLSSACTEENVSLEMELPATWDDFLAGLSGKERHEIRRKWRRLQRAGAARLRVVEEPGDMAVEMDTFLHLFHISRKDKSLFMTETMEGFFRKLAREFAELHMLKLMFLDLAERPVAAVMCFDDGECLHLYNSGYDPDYQSLSVGLMCKVMSIRHAIRQGRKKYDFLKGSEPYKFRLGGMPVEICRCLLNVH